MVNLTISAKSFQKRGRNVVDVEITDTSKIKTGRCHYGCRSRWKPVHGMTILFPALLLTGDLHGYVKDPYYYFQNNSDSLDTAT